MSGIATRTVRSSARRRDGTAAFEFSGADFAEGRDFNHSDFFESLFGHTATGTRGARASDHRAGGDHHAKVQIDLQDSYRGGHRSISLRVPKLDANGKATMQERQLDVTIPKGIRDGQHLRLVGQGGPGRGESPAGDLYLEIEFAPHPLFRVDGRDVYLDLPVAPWEAALGARVTVPTPDGSVQLTVPPGSLPGRTLRLKGQGLPSVPPGDLYAVLSIALPPADTDLAQRAYREMSQTFGDFHPRRALEV
jgi:curved DNA-binding protein